MAKNIQKLFSIQIKEIPIKVINFISIKLANMTNLKIIVSEMCVSLLLELGTSTTFGGCFGNIFQNL